MYISINHIFFALYSKTYKNPNFGKLVLTLTSVIINFTTVQIVKTILMLKFIKSIYRDKKVYRKSLERAQYYSVS